MKDMTHRACRWKSFQWLLVVTVLLSGSVFLAAQQAANETNKWEVLQGCQLATNEFADGDNFQVLHESRRYLFRLYFVDAAESDASVRERVQAQAAYFGISEQDVPRAGKLAATFTRERLSASNFTVTTRWQNAMGPNSPARFYCVVSIGDEDLAGALVSNGLARIYGVRANLPGQRSTDFINALKSLELVAREKQLGLWDTNQFPRVAALENAKPDAVASAPSETAGSSSQLLDLNTATRAELMTLPGIGQVISERILTNRPFSSVDDLQRVPGIGVKTLEKLRPLVRVTPPVEAAPPSD